MTIKKGFCFLLCICVLFAVVTGCSSKKSGQAITYNLEEEPITLDPQIADDYSGRIVIMALYEGLTHLDENNQVSPGVAQRWESNSTYTSFTFYLREDASWSDGTPVTASDFVYAFQRAVDPATGSTTNTPMFAIKNAKRIYEGTMDISNLGVTAIDDHTLKVDLEYSYEDFPSITSLPVFMPCNQAFFESTSGKYGLDAKNILGNGPFEMVNRYSWEHDKYINLTAANTYHGENSVLPSTLTFSIGDLDMNNIKNLSAVSLPNASYISSLEDNGYTITSFQDTTWGLCFNTNDSLMKESTIRKAFIQTLNRESLMQYIPSGCTQANEIIPPDMTFMGTNYRTEAGGNFYLKQDDSAVQSINTVLSEQGLTKMPSITILCLDDPTVKQMVNEMIATWNEAFGNYFNMEPVSQSELEQRVSSGNYSIALCSVRPTSDTPVSLLSLFQSDSHNNPANLKSNIFDQALKDAEGKKPETAIELYAQAEQYLNNEGIFYPIYYEKRYYAIAPGLTGIIVHPYDMGIDFMHAAKT